VIRQIILFSRRTARYKSQTKEILMRIKLFFVASLIIVSMWMITSGLSAAGDPGRMVQGSKSNDQKYAGTWDGTYTTGDGGSNQLSFNFIKDAKGKWSGKVTYKNDSGDQSVDFKSLEIAGGKMKAKIDMPNGQAEAIIEGKFVGNNLEGTYTIISKGSAEVAEKGTWKATKTIAKKT
jgi:flavodoxin